MWCSPWLVDRAGAQRSPDAFDTWRPAQRTPCARGRGASRPGDPMGTPDGEQITLPARGSPRSRTARTAPAHAPRASSTGSRAGCAGPRLALKRGGRRGARVRQIVRLFQAALGEDMPHPAAPAEITHLAPGDAVEPAGRVGAVERRQAAPHHHEDFLHDVVPIGIDAAQRHDPARDVIEPGVVERAEIAARLTGDGGLDGDGRDRRRRLGPGPRRGGHRLLHAPQRARGDENLHAKRTLAQRQGRKGQERAVSPRIQVLVPMRLSSVRRGRGRVTRTSRKRKVSGAYPPVSHSDIVAACRLGSAGASVFSP